MELAIQTIDTLVIGGGQAGLAMSYWLSQKDVPHLIVERGRVAERWHSERWDSLRFQFPNWGVELPGYPYSGDASEGFASRGEVASFIEAYARHIEAPVREGVTVERLRKRDGGFVADTNARSIFARNIVVATGPYQRPAVPPVGAELDGVFQLHTSAYRNPAQLPDGGVLIVGAGASGAQIAAELATTQRRVWLAVGSHRRVPRRYRGYDFHHWEFALGEWDRTTAERREPEPPPLVTGVGGGQDLDLRALATVGVTLTGRLTAVVDRVAKFAPGLGDNLAAGDAYYRQFVEAIDAHALATGLELPLAGPTPATPELACVTMPLRHLDLAAEKVGTVLWATGYALDFSWVDLPVIANGRPVHDKGISPVPGLYFLGLPWLAKRKSTLLAGVGEDAERLAGHIAVRSETSN